MHNKPNFLVVGAPKCGTTSLYSYLTQHPEVFVPEVKECRYFSNVKDKNLNPFTKQEHTDIISDSKEYYNFFKNVNVKAIGDISPDYLYYHKETIKKIKNELGENIKIIIILRDPVQRSYSNYLHILKEGYNKLSFKEIIENEDKWVQENVWNGFYVTKPGYYYESVKNYKNNFKNVKVLIFEEFIKDKKNHLKEICSFLEIDNKFRFKEPSFKNKTGIPKTNMINKLLKENFPLKKTIKMLLIAILGEKFLKRRITILKESNLIKPKLDNDIEAYLQNLYIKDIVSLEKLIEKDLSIWKK